MLTRITKHDWLTAIECRTEAWFALREDADTPSEASLFRMKQGQEIGKLAHELFTGGFLVRADDGCTAAQATAKLVAQETPSVLFEAAFESTALAARADILELQSDGWHVLEVKSSFSDTKSMSDLLDDLSYTVMVARRAGLLVTRASLVLLSRSYRFGDTPAELFEIVDKTVDAFKRADEFDRDAEELIKALLGEDLPRPYLKSACRSCPYFGDRCLGNQATHTVFELPNLHYKKLQGLAADGVVDLADLPPTLALTAIQQRARDSALGNRVIVDSALGTALKCIEWPCYYLDFETVATVLPLYQRHGCHQQVLTQFSVHARDSLHDIPHHDEYLGDPSRDCQEDLAECLILALRDKGSIIVYSHFEKQRITELMRDYPHLAAPLQAILDRLLDLHPVIKNHIYHPGFSGSFSLKKVLPALVPAVSYDGLDIADGDSAITMFARMARGEIIGEEAVRTKRSLLEYCKLDTLAMVKLHDVLAEMADKDSAT